MAKYVALLRGISPTHPNMRNEKLRDIFEGLGCANVKSVLSSGNIIFESSRSATDLEKTIENALHKQLNLTSTTIIRSAQQLQLLVKKKPFEGYQHGRTSYLTVTFLKHKFPSKAQLSVDFPVVVVYDREVCSAIDTTVSRGLDPIARLEKICGKEITTRTWKTVERILEKME
jgi:uncharacterized protein (DUF1697 family)